MQRHFTFVAPMPEELDLARTHAGNIKARCFCPACGIRHYYSYVWSGKAFDTDDWSRNEILKKAKRCRADGTKCPRCYNTSSQSLQIT